MKLLLRYLIQWVIIFVIMLLYKYFTKTDSTYLMIFLYSVALTIVLGISDYIKYRRDRMTK
ncbi:hypothetical protein SAMN05216520_11624 [Kandleria vitulina]|jgi:hypothetical protein|uniref:hypothetical protein n=1 Tax=Kandleria vitulina TaxID=1630 RepID=UPI00048E0891|nr:hypothetical protein [Kandleria vitulina]MEE0989324.1 hypothetical protein [Kandleria vitulina]SDL90255.1 hypothetical protein SAMN05216520_11624 [Kandleria vitulina]HBG67944.1 hypothetical protein [Kandleria vitulina]